MKEDLYIVKIGGNVIDEEDKLVSFLESLSGIKGKKILVHGGGKIASELGKHLGIEPKYHEGRRITDNETIDLVTMVYGGLVNKRIVALMNGNGVNAIGLTGVDGNLIKAHKRPVTNGIDYGYVGDIEKVNDQLLNGILEERLLPVIAPLTFDGAKQILNTNADTIAAAVAASMSVHFNVTLIFCFEKNGVLSDIEKDDSVITRINTESYIDMQKNGTIHSGMLPKMSNAFEALQNGVSEVVIGHSDHISSLTRQDFQICTRIKL